MSAKEIKALIEVGTSMGYSGEELKQFLTEERMRSDKERERQEKEKQMEQERIRAFELEKIRLENETKAKAEIERAKIEAARIEAIISGLDIGPEELKEKQRSDTTLKKYWDLVSKPESKEKPQFVVKNDILYRKYTRKQGDTKIQLVVPTKIREKVVSVALMYTWPIELLLDSAQSFGRPSMSCQ